MIREVDAVANVIFTIKQLVLNAATSIITVVVIIIVVNPSSQQHQHRCSSHLHHSLCHPKCVFPRTSRRQAGMMAWAGGRASSAWLVSSSLASSARPVLPITRTEAKVQEGSGGSGKSGCVKASAMSRKRTKDCWSRFPRRCSLGEKGWRSHTVDPSSPVSES